MSRLNFILEKRATNSRARATRFTTLHGEVQTPIFMPVGTQATVKSQTVDSLKITGSNVLLANTYHLLLRPGPEVLQKFGGIHRFMNWDRPVLTDSGGFQIFSLPHSRKMNEEGALFQSYVDGKMHLLSPELSVQTQRAIGSDIMMVLDQCIASTASHGDATAAMELTHRWAKRSLIARGDSPQAMFGIVQGACFQDLRKRSADFLSSLKIDGVGFDGLAIGGLAVGETKKEREDFTEITTSFLPDHLPRYLMGVGTPIDILEAVHRGIDMFDCILPSQLAQRGVAFTSKGKFQLRRSVYKFSEEKLDSDCDCSTCAHYSRAYLHHLVKSDEVLGWHLITLHNLTFYHRLMREIRASIFEDRFLEYYQSKRETLVLVDEENPSTPKKEKSPSRFEKHKALGNYEVQISEKGFSSIRQLSSGEVMHSVNAPDEEARALYIASSEFEKRLALTQNRPLVIWDVGLGAGHNAMAAIQEITKLLPALQGETPSEPRISLISFEIDLDPLKLALKHPELFPHLRHAAPHAVLNEKEWKSPCERIHWKLFEGDFISLHEHSPVPDLIYFDPFSLKTDTSLWTPQTFEKIFKKISGQKTKLITYSCSTAVREALLSQGFFVGAGSGTGPKSETTVAFTHRDEAIQSGTLLGMEWLDRWSRSQAKNKQLEKLILEHPQFNRELQPPLP